MSKTIREHIFNIQVEKSNLEHIASTGQINGSLLLSIEKAMNDYSESKTQELVRLLKKCKELMENSIFTPHKNTASVITQLLTKYQHLNQKP